MKIFAFDPAEHRDHYAEHGWVHIRDGIDPEFFEVLRRFTDESFGSHKVEGRAIGGRKEQALYEFPPEIDFPGELFDVVADLCGLHRPTMALSERHIKAYDEDAPSVPVPHKDRYASQVSIGLAIDVLGPSRLLLYPYDELEVNPLNVSAAYLQSLPPERRPEVALQDIAPVELDDAPGDVMMFRGNAVWHCRQDAANVTNLYLKLNDFNQDPLGEDPTTEDQRRRTLEAAASGDLDGKVPVLGRRLDCISRRYTRDWDEAVQAELWEQAPVMLSASDLALLELVDGRRSVGDVVGQNGGASGNGELATLQRLAERGVLDLIG
jgi:hypothetical protein